MWADVVNKALVQEAGKTLPSPSDASLEQWKWFFLRRLSVVLVFLGLFWLFAILNVITSGAIAESGGIRPHDFPGGLISIITACFVHHSLGHVAANTIPFIILGMLVLLPEFRTRNSISSHYHAVKVFLSLTIFVAIFSGVVVFLIGASGTLHCGASILIFGYFGYLVALGLFEWHWKSILMSVVVGLLYSGMLWGAFPSDSRASWEGHVAGCAAGVLAAFLQSRQQWLGLWCEGRSDGLDIWSNVCCCTGSQQDEQERTSLLHGNQRASAADTGATGTTVGTAEAAGGSALVAGDTAGDAAV